MGMKFEQLDRNNWAGFGPCRKLMVTRSKKMKKRLGFGAYACKDHQALERLRRRIEDGGISIQPCKSPLVSDPRAFSVTDPDGNIQCFLVEQPSNDASTGLSGKLQHLVVASSDLTAMQTFYSDVIGLSVTDKVVDSNDEQKVSFMRGNEEHHCWAIFAASSNRLDHHCYEAEDWNGIRDWADHLSAHHIPIAWGPGRHGAGNNLFFMFSDPDDNWLEISAELELIETERPIAVWEHTERSLNLWGKGIIRT
jgi:catechol 2,3-dioxygenase-like lactoylglutathione lyase family enzyme